MKKHSIPDNHHIARLCFPKHVFEDLIQATAFHLRPGEEYLSVNWLEFLKRGNRKEEINEIRKTYKSKLNVNPNSKIAVLNVGQMRYKVYIDSIDNRDLQVLHIPSTDDPSHSGIYNLRMDNEFIAELIIETILESYLVSN